MINNISKKQIYITIGAIVTIVLSIIFILFFTQNNEDTFEVIIESETYNLSYEGPMENNKISGKGVILDDGNIRIHGNFEENNLVSGTITLNKKDRQIILNGNFLDYQIQDGEITIIDEKYKVIKSGIFKNGKINGQGTIIITEIETNKTLFTYSGTFEEDIPVYS